MVALILASGIGWKKSQGKFRPHLVAGEAARLDRRYG